MTRILLISTTIMFLSFQAITAQEYKYMTFSKQELLETGKINIYFENFNFDTEINVISYVAIAGWAGADYEVRVKGTNKFTEDVIFLIENINRNGRIYFEDIKVKLADGTIRTLQPIVVKIR